MRVIDVLLRLIYPPRARCMGCSSMAGMERDWLCEACRRDLARSWHGPRMCRGLDGAAMAYYYRGAAGGMVRSLKYRGVTALADQMAADMLRAYEGICPTGAEMVVPVPMHARRKRFRGFNQSEVLAAKMAEKLELPEVNALKRIRNTKQQARLDGEARRKNLEGAFELTTSVKGRRILLVDDVYTTGTTARACADALYDGGAESVYLVTYAAAGDNAD